MEKFIFTAILLLSAGIALAAPAHRHAVSTEMKKQHMVMSQTNKYWRVCKENLRKGNLMSAGASIEQMQKALGDMEKFTLHKNSEMADDFREQAVGFRKNLSQLGKAVKEKDNKRIQSLSEEVSNNCVQCHNIFR